MFCLVCVFKRKKKTTIKGFNCLTVSSIESVTPPPFLIKLCPTAEPSSASYFQTGKHIAMGSFRVYAQWMMLLLQVGVVKWKGHNCYFFVHVLLCIHFDTHSKVMMTNICIIVMKYD